MRLRKALLRYGPYLVTGAVVFAILRRYPIDDILHALGEGRAAAILPVAFGFAILQILLVAALDSIVLRSVLGGPRYVHVVRVRAAAAVLQSIGWVLNVGAYGTWIARATKSGGKTAAALVLYCALSDLAGGALFATITTTLFGVPVGPAIRWGAPLVFVVVLALLIGPPRVAWKPGSEETTHHVFRAVPRKTAVLQLLLRSVEAAQVVTAIWMGANAFGLHLPFGAALSYLPLIILIGSLPVNVLGFGPVQGAWLLLSPWAPGAQILAFQIAWNVAILVAYVVRGALFVPRVLREVAEGRAERETLSSQVPAEVTSSSA